MGWTPIGCVIGFGKLSVKSSFELLEENPISGNWLCR
jgi:hypothetical protein